MQELARKQVPCGTLKHLFRELAKRVVVDSEHVQQSLGSVGNAELVEIHLVQGMEQDVFEDLLASQIIILYVLALMAFEALFEWNNEQAAVHGFRLVLEPRNLVHALNHQPTEKARHGGLVLAVEQERVSRDNRLERRRLVDIRSDVVLVRDNRLYTGKFLKHEILTEILQGNRSPRTFSEQVPHKSTERALSVVA